MPELPEVETVRRGLAATVVGRRLGPVVVTGARTVRRTSGDAVVAGLCGRTIVSAERRGKYLLLPLDSGKLLLIHLRMSGQLLLAPRDSPRPKHTHVAVGLDRDQELRFVDPRTFGEVVVVDPARLAEEAPGVALLGPDAWDDLGSSRALAGVLSARSRGVEAPADRPARHRRAGEHLHRRGASSGGALAVAGVVGRDGGGVSTAPSLDADHPAEGHRGAGFFAGRQPVRRPQR